ncbi:MULTISPECIES: FAD-dependent monooxygenase [unclassified Roseofilum]|uniref:FAD-dependent monooxygenase n=1 Tax=unclassified Roseofilum TaxID=2620099 RepID=UPI000E997880|nr:MULTISPECIES: FAD-dependent monooxygenase [unclassified Roseofilum]HBQ98465.1 zeaxanthin epoxidase [Cyanobacteria bacterium UBA11691]MBP0009202.1 FAD-dependent monooxygenase [Roseofilum sp. Belize Diploria]MBP0014613.1 FAD-dependent monooxygenase [Roseofilum sp. SID3]MBP0026034.1 FAD-dependent monooxygenase [Roseofilum sp. SID2]MBP0033583.1 FAD-dependent monooxygenase [Roseofilum sp. Belize BBD 4]
MTPKVIIIGGGIGGLTCAIACVQAGLEVELYEKRTWEGMVSGPGGIFIQRNAMSVYEKLGLAKALYEKGGKIKKGGFSNAQGKPLYINSPEFVNCSDLGVCLGRPVLQKLLYDALLSGIVQTNKKFVEVREKEEKIEVCFEDGETTWGDVLVGADGLYSQVRVSLNADEVLEPPVYSGMRCWRGCFNPEGINFNPEYSWMEYWGKGNRLAYFTIGDGQRSFYAFDNVPLESPRSQPGTRKSLLRQLFKHYSSPVPQIIEALEETDIYEDNIYDRLPLTPVWGKNRVTLIGDAAHPVQPSIGQGGCMAIEDAYELVYSIKTCADLSQLAQTLRQFEQRRTPRITQVFESSRQISSLGQLENSLSCQVRNWIYRLTPTWLGDLQFKWLFDYQPSGQYSALRGNE